jgi:hypothetical protein
MTDKAQSGKGDADPKGQPDPAEKPRSLNDLLDEWDASGKKPDSSKAKGGDDLTARLSAIERRLASDAYDKEMSTVVETLKGDLDVDDFIVEAWINKQAAQDARLAELYEARDENPAQWQKAIKTLQPEFEKYAKDRVVKPASDNDDKGLGAAVRASKNSPHKSDLSDDGSDIANLDPQQFELRKAEVFRLAKAGKL